MKTVRFTQVVERCGQPHVHALWTDPEHDPEFTRARKTDRVMTLEHAARGSAEFGRVGFDREHPHGSQFLIFPRSLQPFAGARVIGVKFDLIQQPDTLAAEQRVAWAPPKKKPKPRSHAPAAHVESARVVEMRSTREHDGDTTPPAEPPARRTPKARPPRASERRTSREESGHRALLREVRAALGELRAGKTVAAYQRLERALAAAD